MHIGIHTLLNSSLISLMSSHCSERISAGQIFDSMGSVERSAAADCVAIAASIERTRDRSGSPLPPLPLSSSGMCEKFTAGMANFSHI